MKVLFYDPHPGFGGAAIALPKEVKKVVEELNNRELEIEEAIEKIRRVAPKIGKIEISAKPEYILMFWELPNGIIHGWRVIKFKKV